ERAAGDRAQRVAGALGQLGGGLSVQGGLGDLLGHLERGVDRPLAAPHRGARGKTGRAEHSADQPCLVADLPLLDVRTPFDRAGAGPGHPLSGPVVCHVNSEVSPGELIRPRLIPITDYCPARTTPRTPAVPIGTGHYPVPYATRPADTVGPVTMRPVPDRGATLSAR